MINIYNSIMKENTNTKVKIIEQSDYLFMVSGNYHLLKGIKISENIHQSIKHPCNDSEITHGFYYPSCNTVYIFSIDNEKSIKLYDKYSKYKKCMGNGRYNDEIAFPDIHIVDMSKIKNKKDIFKYILCKMKKSEIDICHFRFGEGIGEGFDDDDHVFFMKEKNPYDTLKIHAPHFLTNNYVAFIPYILRSCKNRNLLIRDSNHFYTKYLHSYSTPMDDLNGIWTHTHSRSCMRCDNCQLSLIGCKCSGVKHDSIFDCNTKLESESELTI